MQQNKATQGRSAAMRTPTKSKKNVVKPNRKRRQRERDVSVRQPRMSPCAKEYLRALTDPFGLEVAGSPPCIPDVLDLPSYKLATKCRGTVTIGTNGLGYVVIYSQQNANDTSFGYYTSSTFTGTTVTDVGTGVNPFLDSRLPYTAAAARAHRLVGCGLRVQYIGTELQRGGYLVPGLALAEGDSLLGASITTILDRPDVRSQPTDRAWHGCVYKPMKADAYAYTVVPSVDVDMGVLVTGTPGNQYSFEVIRYHEFINYRPSGGVVRPVPSQTRSHSDLVGLSQVRDFLGSIASSDIGQGVYKAGLRYISNYVAGGTGLPVIEYL